MFSWPEPWPAVTRRARCAGTPPWTPPVVPVALWTPSLQSSCCVESGSPSFCYWSLILHWPAGCEVLRTQTQMNKISKWFKSVRFRRTSMFRELPCLDAWSFSLSALTLWRKFCSSSQRLLASCSWAWRSRETKLLLLIVLFGPWILGCWRSTNCKTQL